ncbi:MAG TPA: type II CAAX endopeptidase family protein [Gemmataceae bacterium]|nr:type II CAAX endopeptidase family protein [Gemmataceae bacterium]
MAHDNWDEDEFSDQDAPPPEVRPARPGPNIWMACVWWLLLQATQIAIGIGVAIILLVISAVQHGPQSLQAQMQKEGAAAISNVPGAVTILFVAGSGGTLLVGAVLVAILFRANARRAIGLRGLNVFHLIIVALVVLPIQIVAGQLMAWSAKFLPHFSGNESLYEKLGQESWIIVLIGGCILPALGEELFFRGFLSRGLVARHGVIAGTFFASFLFGLAHLDPPQVVGTAALAIMLQIVFLNTKSLWGPILLHAFNNALAFGMMRLSQDPALQNTIGGDSVPPLLFGSGLTVLFAMSWLLYETRTRWVLPDGQVWSPFYVTAEMPPAHLAAVPRLTRPRILAVIAAFLALAGFVAALIWEIRFAK